MRGSRQKETINKEGRRRRHVDRERRGKGADVMDLNKPKEQCMLPDCCERNKKQDRLIRTRCRPSLSLTFLLPPFLSLSSPFSFSHNLTTSLATLTLSCTLLTHLTLDIVSTFIHFFLPLFLAHPHLIL